VRALLGVVVVEVVVVEVVVVEVVVVEVVVVEVVVVEVVVVEAEPGAIGAALGMGWMGVTRLVTASEPSSTASSCSRRRSRRATRTHWTSACVVLIARLLVVSSGLQVFGERCHEPVTLCERCARLVGCLLDEDLHPRKGASRCGVAGIAQLIRRIAGDL
jgi:hypothetical protein